MSLYEGTTGIQAQALLGRQVVENQGKSLILWYNEVGRTVQEAEKNAVLSPYWESLIAEMRQLQKVTSHLFTVAAQGNAEVFLSDANLYMEAFGILNVAWQWLRQGIVAQKALSEGSPKGDDLAFYKSKIHTMKFYFHYEVPKLKGLFERLMDTTALTIFEDETEILL